MGGGAGLGLLGGGTGSLGGGTSLRFPASSVLCVHSATSIRPQDIGNIN